MTEKTTSIILAKLFFSRARFSAAKLLILFEKIDSPIHLIQFVENGSGGGNLQGTSRHTQINDFFKLILISEWLLLYAISILFWHLLLLVD